MCNGIHNHFEDSSYRRKHSPGACLRGCTTRVLGKGALRRVLRMWLAMGFTVTKGSEKGSQKGFLEAGFQKVPRTPRRRVRALRLVPSRNKIKCFPAHFSDQTMSRTRQVTDLDVTFLGFSGPGLPSARQVLCGDAPRPLFLSF